MMRSFFIVAIFLASIANTIMAFSPDSSSSTLQTSSFRKISSEITSDDLASAATSAVEEKENRWEAAVDSVHGASAYFASLHRLNSATREEDFRDFLADVSRITTHNAIVAKVEALYAQIAMSSSNGNPELWIAWQKARNYMVLGFTESQLGDYMRKYTFPGYVSDFTPLNFIESTGMWDRDKDRTSHTLVTNGLDWSKFIHPSGWGLFLLTPWQRNDLFDIREVKRTRAFKKVFVNNPPFNIGDNEVKIFSGSGNTRNQFQRFKKGGKFVTFSIKGGGIDCTRGHLSDYPGSFRKRSITTVCKTPPNEWCFSFEKKTMNSPYSVIGGMEASNMGDFDAYNSFFSKMSSTVPAAIKRTMAQGYAVVAIPFIYVKGIKQDFFLRHGAIRTLLDSELERVDENEYMFQAVTWSEAESSLRWTAKLPLCSNNGNSAENIGCTPSDMSDADRFCKAEKVDEETYRIKTYTNHPNKRGRQLKALPDFCDDGKLKYRVNDERQIEVCTDSDLEYDNRKNSYFYDFEKELKEWKAVVDQVLPDTDVPLPSTFASKGNNAKVAYKLLYSLLANLQAFIQSGFSSSPGGESFDPRNFGVGPRDSGDWGTPVRNELNWGVVVYDGHTDLADVRIALYSLPVMFGLCGDTDMTDMLSAVKTGLDVILRGIFNHLPTTDIPASKLWKRMYKPTGNENRWIFPLMVGKIPASRYGHVASTETDTLVKDLFLFHPASYVSGQLSADLYEFEKICACVDGPPSACKDIAASTELKTAIHAACTSGEANAIRTKQQQVSDDAFAPIGQKVAHTWTKMLAKEDKCTWKVQDSPTDLNGMTSCPDASTIATVFPTLAPATEAGHVKEFNDLFNPFLKKHIPGVMGAALKDYPTLKAIFVE